MSLSMQHVYRSANGDRWLLMTDTASGREPECPSVAKV
jgi:hypothetical protein